VKWRRFNAFADAKKGSQSFDWMSGSGLRASAIMRYGRHAINSVLKENVTEQCSHYCSLVV